MRTIVVASALLVTISLTASEPSDSIARGREKIAAGDCEGAIASLQAVVPEAGRISGRKERGEALSAIHFYTALAFSNCGQHNKAREELREFFRLKSGSISIDHSKYPAPFVKAFEQVQSSTGDTHSFEALYPGFNEFADSADDPSSMMLWGASPEFQILADEEEKIGWGRASEPLAQSAFIQKFWDRRDSDTDREGNEFREQIHRRVLFADRAFRTPEEERGSFSDRGRVFVLLGPPARVHRQGLQRFETTIVASRARTPLTGILERWIYFRAQLPGAIPAQQVEFRFITHPGYGESVMQKEFMPLKALAEAKKACLKAVAMAE